jgi:hypothetical protein
VLTLLLALAVPDAHATDVGRSKRLGVGIELGAPSGLSAKYFFNEKQGVSIHLGAWATSRFYVAGQFEFEFLELGDWGWARGDLYGLAGAESGFIYIYPYDHGYLGIYGGAAAELQFNDAPINIYLELGIGLGLSGDGVSSLAVPLVHSVLGARYHF